MSFAEAVARQQEAVFRRLGEDAAWTGVADAVRVKCVTREDTEPFGQSRDVVQVNFVRVRKSEVAAPVEGHVVTLERGPVFVVIAEPLLDRKGVWVCQVAPA